MLMPCVCRMPSPVRFSDRHTETHWKVVGCLVLAGTLPPIRCRSDFAHTNTPHKCNILFNNIPTHIHTSQTRHSNARTDVGGERRTPKNVRYGTMYTTFCAHTVVNAESVSAVYLQALNLIVCYTQSPIRTCVDEECDGTRAR